VRSASRIIGIGLALSTLLTLGCDRGSHPRNIDKPAPEFTLIDGGRSIDLNHLRGRVVVLNLWATNCAPCVEELPSLLALQRRMPSLAVVAISWDEDPAAYQRFLTLHHVDLLTLRDPDQKVATLYGTSLIPETYIIDRNGILRRKFVSAQDWTSPDILNYLRRL
jgi:cytochrome c biogenesis protein CcmG/thiol:disulfide interchange protein DsbE